MRKNQNIVLGSFLLLGLFFTACVKDTNLDPPPPPDYSFSEDFDTLLASYNRGWRLVNRSAPIGPSQWQQGSGEFEAYTSTNNNQGYAFVDYYSTGSGIGVISNWLVSPVVVLKNGDKISFYTRSLLYENPVNMDSADFVNRMQLRINIKNENLPLTNGLDAGDYATLLVDVNPNYYEFVLSKFKTGDANTQKAYPHVWTKYEAVLTNIPAPVKGRFAFRYFLENGGSSGRGSGVGVDHVVFESAR